jgi:hypothetical protein
VRRQQRLALGSGDYGNVHAAVLRYDSTATVLHDDTAASLLRYDDARRHPFDATAHFATQHELTEHAAHATEYDDPRFAFANFAYRHADANANRLRFGHGIGKRDPRSEVHPRQASGTRRESSRAGVQGEGTRRRRALGRPAAVPATALLEPVKPLAVDPGDGRQHLTRDVLRILAKFRAEHGWQPGDTWNPYTGTYVGTAADE